MSKEYILGGLTGLLIAGALATGVSIPNLTEFGSKTLDTQTHRVHVATDNSKLKGIKEAGHEYLIDAKNRNLGQYDNWGSKDIRSMSLTDREALRTQGAQYKATYDFMEETENQYEGFRTWLQMNVFP